MRRPLDPDVGTILVIRSPRSYVSWLIQQCSTVFLQVLTIAMQPSDESDSISSVTWLKVWISGPGAQSAPHVLCNMWESMKRISDGTKVCCCTCGETVWQPGWTGTDLTSPCDGRAPRTANRCDAVALESRLAFGAFSPHEPSCPGCYVAHKISFSSARVHMGGLRLTARCKHYGRRRAGHKASRAQFGGFAPHGSHYAVLISTTRQGPTRNKSFRS